METVKSYLETIHVKYQTLLSLNTTSLFTFFIISILYEGESIKNQPNLFLGEIDLFFFDVIAL